MAEPILEIQSEKSEISETLTNRSIAKWIREHEEPFMEKLQEIADKMDVGYSEIISTEGFEEIFENKTLPKAWKHPIGKTEGKFTGAGTCAVAVAALEQAMLSKYNDNIDIEIYYVSTNHMDMGEEHKEVESIMPHHILRFKARGEKEWWTVDPTYRQFQEKVKMGRILITPAKNEDKLYTYSKHHNAKLKIGDKYAGSYAPQSYPKDKLFERLIMGIVNKVGAKSNLTSLDLYDLQIALLEKK